MLSNRCLSCPVLSVCLSVTFVHSGQTVGWIKMKLGMQVGHGPGHIVLDGDPSPLAHICCGQMAAWIKMPLDMEEGLGPGDFVLDRDPAPPPQKGAGPLPNFRPMSIVAKQLDGSRWHLTWRWALVQATLC